MRRFDTPRLAPLIDPEQELLTYQQVSRRYAVPVGTLHSWVHGGRVPHLRLAPRSVRFHAREIAAWFEARRVPAVG